MIASSVNTGVSVNPTTAAAGRPAEQSQAPAPPDAATSQNTRLEPVDTVTIVTKAAEARSEARKAAEREVTESKDRQKTRTLGDILFAYNYRGDLRIKFMDSASSLIYQVPPVMFSRIADLAQRIQQNINIKA